MAWLTGPQLSEIKYRVLPRKKITAPISAQIDDLIRESVKIDFPERRQQDVEFLVREASKSRKHPNLEVGNSLSLKRQLFARPLSVLAMYGSQPIAHFPVVDNASTRKPALVGLPEMWAKLYNAEGERGGKPYIQSRWFRPGLVALNGLARQMLSRTPDGDPSFLDMMALLAAESRDARQPVAIYPWEGETALLDALPGMGFTQDDSPARKVYAFGPAVSPVVQHRWSQQSVENMRTTILQKNDAAPLFKAAHQKTHYA